MSEHGHEWIVFSTAIEGGCLLVQCVDCGMMGTIDDPSQEEWTEAFHAPSRPYRWHDESRIAPRDKQRLHVVRGVNITCDCPCQAAGNLEYERYPAEIGMPHSPLTGLDREELNALAELVPTGRLCSRLFPHFVLTSHQSFHQETGREPSGIVRELAHRMAKVEQSGLHLSPAIVAQVLRNWARANREED